MIQRPLILKQMEINPIIDWSNTSQWEKVYSPSTDTFFLCDGLKSVSENIPNFSQILEVGCGSGYVTAYCSRLLKSLGKHSIHFATDFNFECCKVTAKTCYENNVMVMPINDNFFNSIKGKIDVVIFNPPYVETPDDELEDAIKKHGIEASWAGGEDGAVVIYDFLNFINNNRSKLSNNFMIVLLISRVNRPRKLKRFCSNNGLDFKIILEKNCQGESLKIVLITPTVE